MEIGAGLAGSAARGLASVAAPLISSPLRISVLEGLVREQVLHEAKARPMVIPRWVPGAPDRPPSNTVFDAHSLYGLHLSIDEVARAQRWLPVDQDRIVFHVYNKSNDAVFFTNVWAEAHPVSVLKALQGCIVQFQGGGSQAKTFGIGVTLHSDRPCPVSVNLGVDSEVLTSRMYQLGPRESLYLVVDAGIALGETAPMLDWRLWLELDANRRIRSGRAARLPLGRKYFIGSRRSFRIVNGAGATRYVTDWDERGTFEWQLEPPYTDWQ